MSPQPCRRALPHATLSPAASRHPAATACRPYPPLAGHAPRLPPPFLPAAEPSLSSPAPSTYAPPLILSSMAGAVNRRHGRAHRRAVSSRLPCCSIVLSNSSACSFGWWLVLICCERKVLLAGGWFVPREKYCWLVAHKPNEQGHLSSEKDDTVCT
jgi:hypothetical protein